MVYSVLIIEHDQQTIDMVESYFKKSGFKTYVAKTGKEGLKQASIIQPDAIVTELDLPGYGGLDLCRDLRFGKNDWTPIILMSEKSEELDAVLGLELGADDYMTKPLRLKELVARVKSTIRRGTKCCHDDVQSSSNQEQSRLIKNGELTIDPDHFLVYKNDRPVDLTKKEFELLYYLAKNKGKALSRERLLQELSADETEMDERIIDVFISRIRNKIEPHRKNHTYVKTVRNIGYMMNVVKERIPS
ncbi:response regulator transcription factor [Alteribacter aurantiacus]|uniref:response regulator transcription factor n=1 Tax=Alteribacter aurantiacus TaxID=254410 RepID=UPI00041862CA|nr:response regulator transcription factor [Alteribacter aurantiacus]